MTPHKVDSGAPPGTNSGAAPPPAPPQDVDSFRAAVSGKAGIVDDLQIEHQHDHEPLPEHRSRKGEVQSRNLERENPAVHRDTTVATAILLQQHKGTPKRHDSHAADLARKQRTRFAPHREREDTMEPLAQLVATLHARQSQSVTELNIVPRAPNPLRLTLQIAGDSDNFVVKARTTLPDDRRDEVRQALHVLERMLTERLPANMRVTVILLA